MVNTQTTERIGRTWLVSFASRDGWRALHRLRRQARIFGFSSRRSFFLDETCLDADFVQTFASRMRRGVRGFGYWCWKPQVILQILRKMPDGDVLLYLDAGCHLNPLGRGRFLDYLDILTRSDMLVFQSRFPSADLHASYLGHFYVEAEWTKGDVFDFFGVRENEHIVRSGQIGSGIIFVRNTARTIGFFERLVEVYRDHFDLANDSPSQSLNFDGFRENRHDQSLFSVMCKLAGYDCCSLSSCEYALYLSSIPGGMQRGVCRSWDEMKGYPIWAKRDISYGWRAWIPHWVKHVCWWMLNLIYKLTGIRFMP